MKVTYKNIVVTAALCSAMLLSTASFATGDTSNQLGESQHNSHQQMSEKKFAKLTRKLGLSESQQSDVKALKKEEKAQMEALKPAMKAFKEQVKALMSAESFDEQAFIALHASNQDVFAQMALIKAKSKFAMKSVLTAEQLEQLQSMMHKRSKRGHR